MKHKITHRLFLLPLILIFLLAAFLCTACATEKSIEAGTVLTAADLTGDPTSVFGTDYDPDCINHAGTYTFSVITGEHAAKYRLRVRDTTAPIGTVNQKTYFAVGATLPDARYCFASVTEADAYTAAYITRPEHFDSLGDYQVQVQLTDASGNSSPIYDAVMTLIYDKVPPEIHGACDFVSYVGEAIAYEKGITLTDNCAGTVRLSVDSTKVNQQLAGSYPVTYTATDAVGNTASVTVTVRILEQTVSEDTLNQRLDAVISSIITPQMDREAQCRAVYTYVQENIAYSGSSDKKDWIAAAYDALFVSRSGDCYSYFAAAKAFLERLNIPNMDIKRTPGLVSETHYWSLVNIGTEANPRWYHFDCTRLTADYKVSGCLLTDAQVVAYDAWRDGSYFRAYDKTLYPASDTKIITHIPQLEPYLSNHS